MDLRRIHGMTRCLGALVVTLSLTACAAAHSAAQPSPAFAVRSGGHATRWVDTHGIAVAVPAAWPDNRGVCGTPKANTVLWNEDGTTLCATGQPPGLSVVEFGGVLLRPQSWYRRHATRVTIDGVRARRWNAGLVSG